MEVKINFDNIYQVKNTTEIGTVRVLMLKGEKGDSGGGGGGTSDYTDLTNKPSINGNTLSGNKTGANLGLISAPSNPSSGDFLVYNGSDWVAMTLSTWQGGSY